MATTTNYGWTTPDDTALVKDGASAIRTLGTSVDTTTKNLNPETTLGDISFRSSTSNVNTRLGIGTTGQVLNVSGGVPAWTTLASGGMTLISTTTLTGASVTLSSIPGTYKNLQLVIRNFIPATDGRTVTMRINGDTGTRYSFLSTNSADNAFGIKTFNLTAFELCAPNDSAVGTGLFVTNLYDYANAVTWKIMDLRGFIVDYTTTTSTAVSNGNGVYNQIDAITSLVLLPSGGNFTSGTALLYGVS